MVNYANGKIYKITGGGLTYIGSTTQPLYKRFSGHKLTKAFFDKGDKSRSCSSSQLLAFDDCCITLIEDFPCERKEQLLARERYYYDLMDCVNKLKPTKTEQDILETNEKVRQHYQENIEKERQRHREKYHRNPERQKLYQEKNKEKISLFQKEYREENKATLSAKKKEMVTCACGVETSKGYLSSHKKTKNHLGIIASLGL